MEAVETVIPVDPPPENKLEGKFWVNAAKTKQVLRKYDVDVAIFDGKNMVEVPMEILEKSNHLWEDFVIVRFLEIAPHIVKVHMIVNKI